MRLQVLSQMSQSSQFLSTGIKENTINIITLKNKHYLEKEIVKYEIMII